MKKTVKSWLNLNEKELKKLKKVSAHCMYGKQC